ncbi:LEA type 2 family protein [candidate division WOR-3 bacterium]|uniref:LEA type 2 family protein n=1 Tax=candidate division WOR-3 bacterium TaxID=2052148 RepID=A0A938BSJ1_UNCW3|nr:LEA type 2 family protein [candidate division WOR-3 bacterium]
MLELGVVRSKGRKWHLKTDSRSAEPFKAELAVAAAYVLWLAACSPSIKTPDVRLRSIDQKSADTTVVGLEIVNPNRFPLRVMSVDYDVSIGDRLCGRGRRSEGLFLDARDTTVADFPLVIDYAGLLSSIPALLTDSVVFSVKGSYLVSTIVGRRRFGFGGERKVAVKDELQSFINGLFED